MVKPISPSEATRLKKAAIPDVVFETFNELIAENISSGTAIVRQDEVVKRLVDKGLNRQEIFDKGWLDVEPIYRKSGWAVSYDKPGFNEDPYPSKFEFRKKRLS